MIFSSFHTVVRVPKLEHATESADALSYFKTLLETCRHRDRPTLLLKERKNKCLTKFQEAIRAKLWSTQTAIGGGRDMSNNKMAVV